MISFSLGSSVEFTLGLVVGERKVNKSWTVKEYSSTWDISSLQTSLGGWRYKDDSATADCYKNDKIIFLSVSLVLLVMADVKWP